MNDCQRIRIRSGFSLVEVNLAILLVALGMLALFGLFPAGLREGELALTDTHAALFADYVLSGIEANASTMTVWNAWGDIGNFRTAIGKNVKEDARPPSMPGGDIVADGTVQGPVSFAGNYLLYLLEVSGTDYTAPGVPQRRTVGLWVWSVQYIGADVRADLSKFKPRAKPFYTEVYFSGVPP